MLYLKVILYFCYCHANIQIEIKLAHSNRSSMGILDDMILIKDFGLIYYLLLKP